MYEHVMSYLAKPCMVGFSYICCSRVCYVCVCLCVSIRSPSKTEEWKLRETRRRHIDELARLGGPKEQVWTGDRASPSEMSPAFRGGGAGRMNGMPEAGPVLVSCRRDCGAHRIRLWVEDLASIGSARVHAIDEATGARIYRDIPDAALSRLLTIFRRSPTCDPDDVDDFLRAMLRACKIRMFPGGLDIALPSEQDLQPEIRPAPLNLRVMQHISAMGNQRLVGQVGQVSFSNQPAKAASAKSIPCMAVAPGHSSISGSVTGITPVTSLNQTQQRPPRPSKPPGRPQPGTPRRPVRRARPQSAPHTGRVEEPKTSKAMEAAFEADAANVACGCPKASNVVAPTPCNPSCEACEAKSYHGQNVTVPTVMPGVAGAFRGRRARPTSAKALKHRRVVDDSVDSIIYEDDEEEQEDQEEVAQVVTEAASQGSLTSGQDTRYGDTGEPLGETGETISESFETTCDSVDSVDCASKLSEVHVRDVEALTMQDIGIHRPTTPMCSMVSMTPVRGAPQLCLNLSPSTSSSNAQGQLGQIGQANPDREMRTLAFNQHLLCLF